jgi:hypothetical protein
LNYFHQIMTLEFFVKYLKLKATRIQFGKIRGQNEKLGCTCLGVCKLKCLVLNVTTSVFFAPWWIEMCLMSNNFYNVMKRDSILWFLYNLIWYKIETFETKSFIANGGLLIINKLQCDNPYRLWKWTHYNPNYVFFKFYKCNVQFKMNFSKPFQHHMKVLWTFNASKNQQSGKVPHVMIL